MYTEYMYKDSLAHFGVKGQKWGVRRYQYEDGRYTPVGEQRRLAKIHGGFYSSIRTKAKSKVNAIKKKNANLTPEERKKRNRRIAIGAAAGVAAVGAAALGVSKAKQISKGRKMLVAMQNAMTRSEMQDEHLHKLLQAAKKNNDSAYVKQLEKQIDRNTQKYVTASDTYKELMKKKSNSKYLAKNAAKLRAQGKLSIR